jgi:hypothetical protein
VATAETGRGNYARRKEARPCALGSRTPRPKTRVRLTMQSDRNLARSLPSQTVEDGGNLRSDILIAHRRSSLIDLSR